MDDDLQLIASLVTLGALLFSLGLVLGFWLGTG